MKRPRERLALIGIIAVGLWARVSHALSSGLWRDEALAVDIATLPSTGAMTDFLVQHESHPPLYYLMLRGWAGIAGATDEALVIPGILIGLGTITLAWSFARRLAGPAAGLLCASLVAFSYSVIESDATVRPYALLQLLLLGSVVLLWLVLVCGSRGALAGWVVTALLLLYTHHWTILPLAAMGLVTMGLSLRGHSAMRPAPLIVAGLAVLVGWLPGLPGVVHQVQHGGHLSPSSSPIIRMAAQLTFVVPGYYDGHGLVAWAGVAAVLFLRRAAPPLQPEVRLGMHLLAGTVLLSMALAAAGSFRTNLLIVHTVAMLAPLALLVIGCVLARPVPQGVLVARAATLLVVAVSLVDAFMIASRPKTNVDLIAAYLSRQASVNDLVLVVPSSVASSVLRYYNGPAPVAGYPDGFVTSLIEFNDRVARDTAPEILKRVPELANRTLANGGRVWQVSFDAPEHLHRHWEQLERDLERRTGGRTQIIAARKEATLEHLDFRLWEVRSPPKSPVR